MQNEKVVETKQCKHCNCSFEITDKDLEFYSKVSPIFAGKKYNIPTPKLCPYCRQQRRMSFRNERKLYKRKCDFSGKDIISVYSPDKLYKVYDKEIWWSDKLNAMDYGRDFDFCKSFFEQFDELMKKLPQLSMIHLDCENSDYTNFTLNNKNCYLVFGGGNNENCIYSEVIGDGEYNVDCSFVFNSNYCYNSTNLKNCYSCFYSINSSNCNDSIYIEDCLNCNNCIFCYGINNKKNYFLNKEVSQEEIINIKKNINSLIKSDYYKKYIEIKKSSPHIYMHSFNSELSSGELIIGSKNCINSYDINGCEDCKSISYMHNAQNSMDCDYASPYGANYSYNICSSTGTCNSISTFLCWRNEKLYYSMNCFDSSSLFGCIGLRNKSHCIFNKQYTKEEYEILVPKIIEHMISTGEWGEFFPSSISPFGYNETVANEYFPLTKEEAISLGFNWSDYEAPFPKVEKIIKAEMLPESIADIPDDILNWAIECEITKKPFRIIKQELEFYRKHNLPIPKRHPDQRHLDRMSLRNPRKLFDRKCDKCGIDMKTTYSPDRKEIVYCEECYNKEIY